AEITAPTSKVIGWDRTFITLTGMSMSLSGSTVRHTCSPLRSSCASVTHLGSFPDRTSVRSLYTTFVGKTASDLDGTTQFDCRMTRRHHPVLSLLHNLCTTPASWISSF